MTTASVLRRSAVVTVVLAAVGWFVSSGSPMQQMVVGVFIIAGAVGAVWLVLVKAISDRAGRRIADSDRDVDPSSFRSTRT